MNPAYLLIFWFGLLIAVWVVVALVVGLWPDAATIGSDAIWASEPAANMRAPP